MRKVNQRGITLIALVVTIIVLIILAGISLNLLLGDNGIIKKAQDVSDKYKEAVNEENIKLSDLDERMQGILGGNGIQGGSGNGNGNNNNISVTPPEETGSLGTAVNTNNYGNIVYNYTAQDLIWKLFYEDSNNYYLISETKDGNYPLLNTYLINSNFSARGDYVSGNDVSSQGKALMPLLGGAISSSAGTIAIGTNSNGINLLTASNTNPNILSTAYICDTRADGPWTAYKTGLASWAMGGPTIELFAASYNATHTNHQILLEIGTYGYSNNTHTDYLLASDNNGIYRLKSSGLEFWWLASPNDAYFDYMCRVNDGDGWIGSHNGFNSYPVRPVVCISKSTGFVCDFEVPRTGVLGTPVNSDKYGNEVTNYTAAGLKWRLFYEDTNNIYLISETQDGDYPINNINVCDYPNSTYAPKDASYVSGESVSQQGKDLLVLAGGTTSCSVGTNSSGYNLFTSSYTNSNIWGTAYLCDTTKWLTYKLDSAAWAMGGPTIELYAASYNATHTNHQISLGMSNFGYTYNTQDNWFLTTENNGIYYLKDTGSWWIPAPDGTWQNERVSGTYEGRGKINCIRARDDSVSARPVVCIQKSTGFTCNFGS